MSSTALTLVKRIARMTGDYDPNQITTIVGGANGLAERIVDFLNQTIGDVEDVMNWPILRVNAQGTGDGTTDVFEFSGVETVKVGGPVSVWIAGHQALKELTPAQFDSVAAEASVVGLPEYFQRGVATSGNAQVQIYPAPALNSTINMSAYKTATRFDPTVDSSTTELDDDILVYGALMHMDLYDGLDRNYAVLYKNHLDRTLLSTYSNSAVGVTVEDYR